MKIRKVSSLALAGVLALGASGCSLVAPVATTKAYAPSDGIQVDVGGVNVRNVLLIAEQPGDPYNLVFTTVNNTGAEQQLVVELDGEAGAASAEITIPTGTTLFGDPQDTAGNLVIVELGDQVIGSTVDASFEITGAGAETNKIPVLDGHLEEYKNLTVSAAEFEAMQKAEKESGDETSAQ